ncbi:MAG: hypothetical protein ACOC3T_02785 [Bacteroidota bacterium]
MIIAVLAITYGCGRSKTQGVVFQYYLDIAIKNQSEIYILADYVRYEHETGNVTFGGTNYGSGEYTAYLLKWNPVTGEKKVVKRFAPGEVLHYLAYKDNYILAANGQANVIDENSYNIVQHIPHSTNELTDFIGPGEKILDSFMFEYNNATQTITRIKDIWTRDAKYCPTDDSLIAYVGRSITADNMAGDIYLINSDSTGNTRIVSGYNAELLAWKPDGNSLVFINNSEIYSVNKDGSSINKIRDYSPPAKYDTDLTHNTLAFEYPAYEITVIYF